MRRAAGFGWGLAGVCMTAALVVGAAAEARATRDAPPAGHTGGFGEPTCQDCHFEAEPNSGQGRLTLGGVPASYVPGRVHTLTVTLTQEGLKAGGFQLTARRADGTQAGAFPPDEGVPRRSGVTVMGGVAYAHHVLAGTDPLGPDSVGWTLRWTAPPEGGTVIFHLAANAGNDDASPLGDQIYTLERRVGSATKGSARSGMRARSRLRQRSRSRPFIAASGRRTFTT